MQEAAAAQDLSAAAALVDHGQAALVKTAATPDSTAQLQSERELLNDCYGWH